MPLKISQEKINIIEKRIKEGKFYSDIARELNISRDCVLRYAKMLNISTGVRHKRKSVLNEYVFENIDSEEKAYWLGFLIADGGTCYTTDYYKKCNRPNRLYINLSLKDVNMLDKFKIFLNTNTKIRFYIPEQTYSNNEMCQLIINSINICSSLNKYGIYPNKTGHEIIPTISIDLMRHLIRGYFDGDGTVYIHKNKYICVGFSGNEKFLLDLKQLLKSYKIIKNDNKVSKEMYDKQCYSFRFSNKEDVSNFFHYIYDNSNIYMERKYCIFGNSILQ